jgi:hypothetical protein
MAKHTEGPWRKYWSESNKRTHEGTWIFFGRDPAFPHNTTGRLVSLRKQTGEPEANARLIEAAPDLLRACVGLVDMLEEWDSGFTKPGEEFEAVTEARAAIAKALGEAVANA